MNKLLHIWQQPIGASALPTLIHHLCHIGGGFVMRDIVFMLTLHLGVSGAACISMIVSLALFFTIEILLTGPIKTFYYVRTIDDGATRKRAIMAHWKDCIFDFQQYAFQVVMYPLSLGDITLALILLGAMIAIYFTLLLLGW